MVTGEYPLIVYNKEGKIMMYQTLFCGIDIGKEKHDIAMLNQDKKRVHKSFVIPESREGYQFLAEKFKWLQEKYQTEQFLVGMEATGDYWKNLHHFLTGQSNGFVVSVINPYQTRAYANSELRRAKTDKVEAKDIARFMIEKTPPATKQASAVFDSIRDLDRQIYAIKKQKTMTINRLRVELSKTAPEIEKAFQQIGRRQILAVLEQFPTSEVINAASVKEIAEVRFGSRQWRIPLVLAEKVKSLVQNSIAYKTGPGAGFAVQSLVRRILESQFEIERLENQIIRLYANFKEQDSILSSIYGIGVETAIALEAYIGDVNRFSNSKKIVAYFGMNPTICQSGTSLKRKSRLQKKGNAIVRHKLYLAVFCIIGKKKGPLYKYYTRLVDSGKPKMVAIGATMRKLLVVIYAMLKNQEAYDPEKM
jgi:transposase